MLLTVNKPTSEAKSRVALIYVLALNLRLMEGWRRTQARILGDPLDCESTLILMAIIVIGAENLLRSGEIGEFENLAVPMDVTCLRRCNLSSIAATTGLNRETVRRKVKALEKLGMVVREAGEGVRMADLLMQRDEIRDAVKDQLASIAGTVERLQKEDLLSHSGSATGG
jgi:DNA-binding MarR family transcriptional regulator